MGSQLSRQQRLELRLFADKLSLTEENRQYAVNTFHAFCRHKQRTMSREDFRVCFQTLKFETYTECLVDTIFEVVDTNSDGELSAIEFIRYFLLLIRLPAETKMQIVFQMIDRDGNALIEVHELRKFYGDLVCARAFLTNGRLVVPVPQDEDVNRIFAKMDADGNQRVSLEEFLDYSKVHGSHLLKLLDASLDDGDSSV